MENKTWDYLQSLVFREIADAKRDGNKEREAELEKMGYELDEIYNFWTVRQAR